ncbi:MAG: T9SS type A sorting domain-containing protein [Bacteroidota bacterium]|nr:T9SS type A sorting domain-containing protein [Bacteroidota bacterium]
MRSISLSNLIKVGLIVLFIQTHSYTQLTLTISSQSNSGGISHAGPYSLVAIMGQPATIGIATSGSSSVGSGFIYTAASDAQGPTVTHTLSATIPVNTPLVVSATITDISGISSARLYYRKGGEQSFSTLTMSPTGNLYQATIPDSIITLRGLEYYIVAKDVYSNQTRLPQQGIFSIQVTSTAEGVSRATPQPNGSEQSAYRLISIPFDATDKTPAAVLGDDLGGYDNTKWRFYELGANQKYVEHPGTSPMDSGKAFWLIVKDAGKIIDTGPGKSNPTNKIFAIALDSGWTFIGNPFNFDIPFTKLSKKSGGTLDARYYGGSWTNAASPLKPFEGYAVSSTIPDTLFIDPQVYPVDPTISKSTKEENTVSPLWSITIQAQCNGAQDVDNVASVSSSASQDFDEQDKPEPPVIGNYVSVYFPHPQWKKVFKHYNVDARPEPSDGDVWNFEVTSNMKEKVNLKFVGIENVPTKFDVWLIDMHSRATQNLRESNTYSFSNTSESVPHSIALVVGTSAYIQEKLIEVEAVPGVFQLFQNYPNPFNPVTIIRYGLPSASHVRLKLYNILGEEVMTLVDEFQQKGFRAVELNAKNLPSGVYYYRIQANDFIQTKKLILLK